MQKASLIAILLVLIASLLLLSVLSNVLTGYPEPPLPPETEKNHTENDTKEEPSILLFKVSPIVPESYCRVSTADYYTGLDWVTTTNEKVLEELPQAQDANASEVFTVEINVTERETLLPLIPPNSTLAGLSLASNEDLRFYVDEVGNFYKVTKPGQVKEVPLTYNVSWRDVEVDDRLISLDNISEEHLDKYLQLPEIPIEVWELAKDLEDPSYSILDQILADVQYLRTDFVYDTEARERAREHMYIPQRSDVFSYIQRKKGVCMDAATALAVILRIQEIPARISIGYKAARVKDGKLLYYTTGGHAVTEVLLPPYGWVQFDATPPAEENPLVKVSPFKKEGSSGSQLFYQLSITNRRNLTDNLKLFVSSEQKWDAKVAPEDLKIEALQTAEALLEVSIPDEADVGEKDVVTITVASRGYLGVAFSVKAVTQVENIVHVSTITSLKNADEAVIRGDPFWINGTVRTASDERVDNMTIFVFLTKSTEAEGMIIGKGYSEQGNFQIESRMPCFIEIGDYKVVAISLGTERYAPSSSDAIVRVCATTKIKLGREEDFLLGYGVIHGRLLWDNGTGLVNAPVSLKIASLATPSEVLKLQSLTSRNGSFEIETTFENAGTHEVEAVFSGNEYVLGCNATQVVELKRGLPTIQIIGGKTAIRGEVFNITGTVQFENVGIWGEPVNIIFDNRLLASVETRDNGSFTWSFCVDPEEKLGSHLVSAASPRGNASAVHKVLVKSKTRLTTEVSDVAGGMLLLLSASLVDDHNLPIRDAEVAVNSYGLSWKTDKNGNLAFLLETVKPWPESLVLAARFEGSELYLPATIKKEIFLEPVISLPLLIPLVAPTSIVMMFVYAKHFAGKPQASRQISDVKVEEERVMIKEEAIRGSQKMQPLKIGFPDIETQFPNVWGVKDKLRIEITLDKSLLEKLRSKDVEVSIDEETVASVRFSQQGRTELSHEFVVNGEHTVRAVLGRTSRHQPWNAETKLRIVDYREEIVRLYNEFLEKLAGYGIDAGKEMTAREIESLALRMSAFCPEPLRKVTICFEKAEYSNQMAIRRDYEIMYLSSKELNMDVE